MKRALVLVLVVLAVVGFALPAQADDFVGGLVVSTSVDQDEYRAWGANGVVLWEAEDAVEWTLPTVVWLTEDGMGQVALPTGERRYGPVALPSTVVGVQQGDEPYEPLSGRLSASVPVWTNFSYWAPMAKGEVVDMEAALDPILAAYEGDRLSVSEYLLTEQRLVTLAYFRRWALEKDIPLWQYLNAYRGYETQGKASQTLSDYRWSAFTGQAAGATGHVWFAYAIGPGHPEATKWGGSTLDLPEHWEWTRSVNLSLRRFSRLLDGRTSTSFTWNDDLVVGAFGVWVTMLVNNRTDPLTVEVECGLRSTGQRVTGLVTLDPGDAVIDYRCVLDLLN